jgi:uncharacterized phiE125 gp8 family phage protein
LITLITPPSEEPVVIDDLKTHLRLNLNSNGQADDEDYVTALITAARTQAETFTRRALITQTWDHYSDTFPTSGFLPTAGTAIYSNIKNFFRMPMPRLQSVTYIKYTDVNGVLQTMPSTDYVVDSVSEPARIYPAYGKYWPATQFIPNAVQIRFVAGYGARAAVPMTIRQAIMVMVADMYENRESFQVGSGSAIKLPSAAESLLWNHRVLEF